MKKTTGGRNGYGAKLANIFSTRFTIETTDKSSGKKYRQTFRNNMTVREEPAVTNMGPKESEYTCVTFEPDLARFKMERLDDATVGLLSKRAYDVAGCASGYPGKPLKVHLNGEKLPMASFQDVSPCFVCMCMCVLVFFHFIEQIHSLTHSHTHTHNQNYSTSSSTTALNRLWPSRKSTLAGRWASVSRTDSSSKSPSSTASAP